MCHRTAQNVPQHTQKDLCATGRHKMCHTARHKNTFRLKLLKDRKQEQEQEQQEQQSNH
jgi:hypothetical protein